MVEEYVVATNEIALVEAPQTLLSERREYLLVAGVAGRLEGQLHDQRSDCCFASLRSFPGDGGHFLLED